MYISNRRHSFNSDIFETRLLGKKAIWSSLIEFCNKKVNLLENTILHRFAWHRDLEGNLLDTETVAVEVINILRPIVAIAVFINFIALAVHHYPNEREKLESGDEKYAQMFVQEVRRFYPFFPFVMALVKKDFFWKGYKFEEGTLTLLDLYGTNHDPVIQENSEFFSPERFTKWEENPFDFIPQVVEITLWGIVVQASG